MNSSGQRYSLAEWAELVVTLYHDAPGNNVFLGEVRVALSGPQAQAHAANNAWSVFYYIFLIVLVFINYLH